MMVRVAKASGFTNINTIEKQTHLLLNPWNRQTNKLCTILQRIYYKFETFSLYLFTKKPQLHEWR